MNRLNKLYRILFIMLFVFSANSFVITTGKPFLCLIGALAFLSVNLLCGFTDRQIKSFRLRICNHGAESLLIFSASVVISIIIHIAFAFVLLPLQYITYIMSALICIFAHIILFWNGIISVYCTSVQLGIKYRVIGALCGYIPIVHLFVLRKIIQVTVKEVKFETQKDLLNRNRENQQICKTKYPVLFVHGVFFRDIEKLNYWGRIPRELIRNGATVFYGEHQSALSIADSAKELTARIKDITEKTGCEKVNIIAHSKGGLDCRYALSYNNIAPYVASLTTINTPHRGCDFADYLLDKISQSVQDKLALTYNKAALKIGDTNPDFMAAVKDLTAKTCQRLDKEMETPQGVYCQSFGSVLKKATNGKFPLNFSYPLVKFFDGPNDGLVATDSFEWRENYKLLIPKGNRGISHGDMIDLNRENIPEFDVREFYVQLVADLKNKGL